MHIQGMDWLLELFITLVCVGIALLIYAYVSTFSDE